MGCGTSKLETVGDAPAGMPAPLRPVWRRIEEVKARRRKDSVISTTALLLPEEEEDTAPAAATAEEATHGGLLHVDGGICCVCGWNPAMTAPTAVVEGETAKGVEEGEITATEEEMKEKAEGEEKRQEEMVDQGMEEEKKKQEDEKEGVRGEKGEEENEGEKSVVGGAALLSGCGRRSGYVEEELPGSPSFRVYFERSVRESSDDDSASVGRNASGSKRDDKVRSDSVYSSNSDESEDKSSKKHKARRFKSLMRKSSGVYGLLNVRGCYSINASSSPRKNPSSIHRLCYSSGGSTHNNTV